MAPGDPRGRAGGCGRRVAGAPAADGSRAAHGPGVRAARSRGDAQGRCPGRAQGDRVRPGDGQAVATRTTPSSRAKYTGAALEALRAEAARSGRARRGRRWRRRGHDRCQGSSPPLRCDFGAAGRAVLPDMWPASGAGRGVLLDLRAAAFAGWRLRRLRGRARRRQPVLRAMRHRRGGVSHAASQVDTAALAASLAAPERPGSSGDIQIFGSVMATRA